MFWKAVLWFNENKLELFGPVDVPLFCEEGDSSQVKYGIGSIMLWSSVAISGTGYLVQVQGIVRQIRSQC